jgi:hypothetical protein
MIDLTLSNIEPFIHRVLLFKLTAKRAINAAQQKVTIKTRILMTMISLMRFAIEAQQSVTNSRVVCDVISN